MPMILPSEGHRTNKGDRFRVTFISRNLRNRAYIGILDYNRYQGRGDPEPIAIPGLYPPIIDQKLFEQVQNKLKMESDNFQDAFAHRTKCLLSRLVVCDYCGHQLQSWGSTTIARAVCTYGADGALGAPLLNKEILEKAVLAQIQEQILSEENVHKQISLVLEQTSNNPRPNRAPRKRPGIGATEIDAKLNRWEETLEGGLLSLEDCAARIKELHQQREALLKRKVELHKKARAGAKVLPIPTRLVNEYVHQMQMRCDRKISALERNLSGKF